MSDCERLTDMALLSNVQFAAAMAICSIACGEQTFNKPFSECVVAEEVQYDSSEIRTLVESCPSLRSMDVTGVATALKELVACKEPVKAVWNMSVKSRAEEALYILEEHQGVREHCRLEHEILAYYRETFLPAMAVCEVRAAAALIVCSVACGEAFSDPESECLPVMNEGQLEVPEIRKLVEECPSLRNMSESAVRAVLMRIAAERTAGVVCVHRSVRGLAHDHESIRRQLSVEREILRYFLLTFLPAAVEHYDPFPLRVSKNGVDFFKF